MSLLGYRDHLVIRGNDIYHELAVTEFDGGDVIVEVSDRDGSAGICLTHGQLRQLRDCLTGILEGGEGGLPDDS